MFAAVNDTLVGLMGPLGPLFAVGLLGVLLILVTLPTMLRKQRDRFSELKTETRARATTRHCAAPATARPKTGQVQALP